MSDERPDKCPTCGSADPTDRPIVRRHDLHERQGNYLEPAHTPCPDPFHDPAPKPQGLDAVSASLDEKEGER